jgi:hypothetical protein
LLTSSAYFQLGSISGLDIIKYQHSSKPCPIEGGYIISFNSTTSNGGSLLLKPGTGAGGGSNGQVKIDGVLAFTGAYNIGGGTSGSPVSLQNQVSFITLLPVSGSNNYYQLPNPSSYSGRSYIIRNNSGSFTTILSTATGLLYAGNSEVGSSTYTLNPTASPKTVMAISDGSNWIVMVQD